MDSALRARDVPSKAFSLQNYIFRVLRGTGTFLEAFWKERKTAVMNLNAGDKKQARFDK